LSKIGVIFNSFAPKSKTNKQTNKSVCPRLTEAGEMNESDCSQAGGWNCISPGFEALINVLSGKERMRTKVGCDWLYGGTIKGFPQTCGHIEGNLSGPKVIIIIIYLSWSWATC